MLSVFIRTLLMFLLLVGGLRLLGKRQVGQLEPSEFVVTMMTANLATAAVEDPGSGLLPSLTAIAAVLGAELTLTWLAMSSQPMRRLLCGKPVILIENGKINERNLRSTRLTLDELTARLREKDVLDPKKVQYAILETDGALSVFLDPRDRPATAAESGITPDPLSLPVTLVEDGVLLMENLRYAGKDPDWVRKVLRDRGADLEKTLLLTVDGNGKILFLRKEESS